MATVTASDNSTDLGIRNLGKASPRMPPGGWGQAIDSKRRSGSKSAISKRFGVGPLDGVTGCPAKSAAQAPGGAGQRRALAEQPAQGQIEVPLGQPMQVQL